MSSDSQEHDLIIYSVEFIDLRRTKSRVVEKTLPQMCRKPLTFRVHVQLRSIRAAAK